MLGEGNEQNYPTTSRTIQQHTLHHRSSSLLNISDRMDVFTVAGDATDVL